MVEIMMLYASVNILFAVVVVLCLLLPAALSAPTPRDLLINEETKECRESGQGDECSVCFFPKPWKSIGLAYSDAVVCPEGYTMIEYEYDYWSDYCIGSRSSDCCGSSISPGDCKYLVFNPDEQKCAFSLCQELPNGWTRELPEGYRDDRCPISYSEPFVVPESLECDDPCQSISSCADCAREGCAWSNNTCQVECKGWGRCFSFNGEPGSETSVEDLCNEFDTYHQDNDACRQQTRCSDCTETSLPSSPSEPCRWVNSCGGESGVSCEGCYASGCSGTCNELCDADTCTSCVEQGCFWKRNGGCYRSCPGNRDCAGFTDESFDECPELICQNLEDRFWDLEHCLVKQSCSNCLETVLPSSENVTCKWIEFSYEWSDSKNTRCSAGCREVLSSCREVEVCSPSEARCSNFFSCDDCLSEGCFWFDRNCESKCPDDATCLENGMIPDGTSTVDFCLSSLTDRNDLFTWPPTCGYPPDTPCEICLRQACAWNAGECREMCPVGSPSGNCTTVWDLLNDTEDQRLETLMYDACRVDMSCSASADTPTPAPTGKNQTSPPTATPTGNQTSTLTPTPSSNPTSPPTLTPTSNETSSPTTAPTSNQSTPSKAPSRGRRLSHWLVLITLIVLTHAV